MEDFKKFNLMKEEPTTASGGTEQDAAHSFEKSDLTKYCETIESELTRLRSELQQEWVLSREKMPDFDGFYYVYGYQHHSCGTVTPFHMIAECRMNQWVKPDIGYQMTYWRSLLQPPKIINNEE